MTGPTVRVQPDGYLLEIGRDGEDVPIATMACHSEKAGTDLAESLCDKMRTAYWWRVFPVIFGDPDAAERRAQMRAAIATEKNAPRDLFASANSPGTPEPSPTAPTVKIEMETGLPKKDPTLSPDTGACLNCGSRMGAPHMCTDGEAFHRVAWCGECGAFHAQGTPDDGPGWSVETPTVDGMERRPHGTGVCCNCHSVSDSLICPRCEG